MPDAAFQMLKVTAWANLSNLRHAERESLGRGGPVKTENSSWLMAIEAPVRLKDMLDGSRRASAVAIAFPQLRLYVKKQKLTCDVLSSTVCNQLYVLPLCHSSSNKGPAKGLKAQPEHDSQPRPARVSHANRISRHLLPTTFFAGRLETLRRPKILPQCRIQFPFPPPNYQLCNPLPAVLLPPSLAAPLGTRPRHQHGS
jgi:hypothetical protein